MRAAISPLRPSPRASTRRLSRPQTCIRVPATRASGQQLSVQPDAECKGVGAGVADFGASGSGTIPPGTSSVPGLEIGANGGGGRYGQQGMALERQGPGQPVLDSTSKPVGWQFVIGDIPPWVFVGHHTASPVVQLGQAGRSLGTYTNNVPIILHMARGAILLGPTPWPDNTNLCYTLYVAVGGILLSPAP